MRKDAKTESSVFSVKNKQGSDERKCRKRMESKFTKNRNWSTLNTGWRRLSKGTVVLEESMATLLNHVEPQRMILHRKDNNY